MKMLNQRQIDRMLAKLERFAYTLERSYFKKVGEVEMRAYPSDGSHHEIPNDRLFQPVEKGWRWGGEGSYCWFKGEFTVPDALAGQDLFLRPHCVGYESLLWVNGVPFGTFCNKILVNDHGNHYCNLIRKNAKAGETVAVALESYAGHYVMGTAPFEEKERSSYQYSYHGAEICVKNEEIIGFAIDLHTVRQLACVLPESSFRRGDLIDALTKVHETVYYDSGNIEWEDFLSALCAARPYLQQALAVKNAQSAPFAGLIGHSHMDTAWLWHIGETVKKCARTYSSQISLMEQYPEYTFIQSSSYHSEVIRRSYPALFEQMQKRVREGRYEPNGGVWVECDCNITSGESMIRQFLWGQRFTRRYFGYTSNCFWLPDTFGYSAAIPQIMKGCGVDYFLTTKIQWNDTNEFPYDTFYWQGIDGTRVFTHFNKTHIWPDAADIYHYTVESEEGDVVRQKQVSDMRLISYGFGDGGGGPQFEMIEAARRCRDTDGCPRAEHVRVGEFMQQLEQSAHDPATYSGELYLELHRGTLTNQHRIKRNNRKAEIRLHDLEAVAVQKAVQEGAAASEAEIVPLVETLLVNQFHDILPGTCIPRAHEESLAATDALLGQAQKQLDALTGYRQDAEQLTLVNTLSFDREDVLFLEDRPGSRVGGYRQQAYTDLRGLQKRMVAGVRIPALSSAKLCFEPEGDSPVPESDSPFSESGNTLSTPYAKVTFDEKGCIASFIDLRNGRELCGEGYALNTFLLAEDVPVSYDNWDVDADIQLKFHDCAQLLSRKTVSTGPVAHIIRSTYRLTPKSTLTQDMIFLADSAEVRFDTQINWNDDHRFLKTAFDTAIFTDFARFEVQFGNVKRPTTRNTTIEQAKFEVLNHKYTDLSESRYGAALLNDCKYGISVEGGQMRLSLHKGGCRPDYKGDHGVHSCVYSFLPHEGSFAVDNVVKPAYLLNYPPVLAGVSFAALPLVLPEADNILVETVKPCEDEDRAFIVRLYDAEGTYTNTPVRFFSGAKSVSLCNMLEEPQETIEDLASASLCFHPFEIKTLRVTY
jgi:alpha-mannosidase